MTPQPQDQDETPQREQAHDEDERLDDLDPGDDEAAAVQGGRTLHAVLDSYTQSL